MRLYNHKLKEKPHSTKRRKQGDNLVLVGLVTFLLQVRGLGWFYYSMIPWMKETDCVKCSIYNQYSVTQEVNLQYYLV